MIATSPPTVRILETTIRDGSYEVGFQFTRQDVAKLGGLLDEAGFSFIEIGHGNGLAGDVFGETAAASDEEYMETARRAVVRAKLGALMGFNKRSEEQLLGSVRAAARAGLDYLRLGFVPKSSESPVILKCLDLARELGLTVSANLMRTYCAAPGEIAERCQRLLERGVNWIYVVDSAGGMTPADVQAYVRAIREAGAPVVGFHGHNNIQSALANSLAAIEAGATMIDTSLQGLGRTTGNTQTEVLLTFLQLRYGCEQEVDRGLVYRLARRYVQPLVEPGLDPTHVLAGVLNVHSSSLPQIQDFAGRFGLDVDALLARAGVRAGEAGALDKRDLPDAIVQTACEELAGAPAAPICDLRRIAEHAADHHGGPPHDLADLFARLKVAAERDHFQVALVLAPSACWPFDGLGLVRRQGWAFGLIPVDPGADIDVPRELVELREHLVQVPASIKHVIAGDRLAASNWLGDAAPATILTVRYEDALAEAAVATDLGRPAIVAIDDERIRAALLGRLSGCPELQVVPGPHAEPESAQTDATVQAGPGAFRIRREGGGRNVFAGGALGAQLLEVASACELSAGDVVTLVGRTPLTRHAIAALAASGAQVRLPDPFPLLLARLSMRDRVRLVDGGSDDLIAALEQREPGTAVAWGGHVVDLDGGEPAAWNQTSPSPPAELDGIRRSLAVAAELVRLRRIAE
jgi:4-hydroxy-2-oxovalerate aldolase